MQEGFYYADGFGKKRTPLGVMKFGDGFIAHEITSSNYGLEITEYSNYKKMSSEEVQKLHLQMVSGLQNLSNFSDEESLEAKEVLKKDIETFENWMWKYDVPIQNKLQTKNPRFINNPFEGLTI